MAHRRRGGRPRSDESDESDEADEGDDGQCWIRGKDLSYRQLLHAALRPVRCWDHALHYTRVWGIEYYYIAAAPTCSNHPAASRGSSHNINGSEDLCPPPLGASATLYKSTAQESGPGEGATRGAGKWEASTTTGAVEHIEISYSLPCAVMRLLPSSCTGDTPGRPWDTTTRLRSCMADSCTETWIHTAATSMLSNRSLCPRPLPPARSPKAKFPISSTGPASYDDLAYLALSGPQPPPGIKGVLGRPLIVRLHRPVQVRTFIITGRRSAVPVRASAHLGPISIDDTAETPFSFLLDANPSTYIASCSREDWP